MQFEKVKIKNISFRHFEGNVYDLTVSDDNSYIANGIAVHNCEDCEAAMAGNPWKLEDIPEPGTDTICAGFCRHAIQILSKEEE